jgi:hypothetical protein
MGTFKLSILVGAKDMDEALEKVENSILRKNDNLVLIEADDKTNEIWYQERD